MNPERALPRTTHDLDFVIQLPPSAVANIVAAFSPDFDLDEASVRAAYRPPHQFNAIDTRSALKVDFWLTTPVPVVPFEGQWRSVPVEELVQVFGDPLPLQFQREQRLESVARGQVLKGHETEFDPQGRREESQRQAQRPVPVH